MKFTINRQDEAIYVAIHDEEGYPLEFLKLAEGHPAFGWSDDELIAYLTKKLKNFLD